MTDKLKIGGGYVSQAVVVILYISGMMLNYYLLREIVIREQYGRMRGEINYYISEFYPRWDDAISGRTTFDEIFYDVVDTTNYSGTFSILTPDGRIIYDINGRKGNAFRHFTDSFGPVAREVLVSQLMNPKEQGWVEYNEDLSLASFVRYDKVRNVVFFHQFDPFKSLSRIIKVYYRLLAFFLLGGVVIIFVGFMNVRKMNEKLRQELTTRRDLDTAAAIQSAMLPKGKRHLMQVDISAQLVPAQGVGGDFFYYTLLRGKLYFCIGDVSGKGIPASLGMSRAVTLFHSLAEEELSPSRITSKMNVELCGNNEQNIFITAIIGVMDVWNGMTSYCNAGHGRPLYWNGKSESGCRFIEGQGGLPLGFDESSQYEEYQLEFEANGMILLCTDGVNEAKGKHKQLYGFDRLVSFADRNKDKTAEDINKALLKDIHKFAEGMQQSDDITILTFRNIARPKILEFRNNVKELKKLPEFLVGIFKECPLDDKSRIKVRAGLDEALTNCVMYAYPQEQGSIQLAASIENHCLVFKITDSGVAFNPVEYESSMTGEIKVGGLGIAMVKTSFDEMNYNRIDGKNILRLTIKL